MGLVKIDGQPLAFNFVDDSCPECDDRTYCTKVADGDVTHVQFKNEPCGENLVCDIEISTGAEEIQNPSFDSGSTGWTVGANWNIAAGEAYHTAGSVAPLEQITGNFLGGIYSVEIHMTITAGTLTFMSGSRTVVFNTTQIYVNPAKSFFDVGVAFTPSSDFAGGIQFISVKKNSYGCFGDTLPDGWSITYNQLCHSTGFTDPLPLTTIAEVNTWYEVEINLISLSSGSVNVAVGANSFVADKLGQNKGWIYSDGSTAIVVTNTTDFVGCIDLFSIKDQLRNHTILLNESDGSPYVDLTASNVATYQDDYLTIAIDWVNLELIHGCYELCVVDPCGGDEILCNNSFDIAVPAATGYLNCGVTSFLSNDVISGYIKILGDGVAVIDNNSGIIAQLAWSWGTSEIPYPVGTCFRFNVRFQDEGNLQGVGFQVGNDSDSVIIDGSKDYSVEITLTGNQIAGATIQVLLVSDTGSINAILESVSLTLCEEVYCSNCIDYKATHKCTKMITGVSKDTAFGFAPNFPLSQRLEVRKFNPFYPEQRNEYLYSNGKREITFAQSEKKYTLGIGLIDEIAHNCLRLQKASDQFFIEDVEYSTEGGDYVPDYPTDFMSNLAPAKFIIAPKPSVKFNSNG